MKKIGFFGGTFDPIHFGHLSLARDLMESHGLDEVLFCPAARSPFKQHKPSAASVKDRLAMTQLAIEDQPRFKLCSLEAEQEGVSYTVDTLRKLHSSHAQLYLLLSADSLKDFHLWKNPEEIVKLAPPLIGSRPGFSPEIPPSSVREALLRGLTPTTQLDISSTAIRERLKKRLSCEGLVPEKVLDYIDRHQLYC